MSPPPETVPISVVMPVHNALPHLDQAVQSILGQSWGDFEFVIFDDGSTDGSTKRLEEWARSDARIRLVKSERNLGPAASSNEVVRSARGRLIARMDADDVSEPDRLQRQIALLDQRPEVGVVGTMHETIDAKGRTIRGPNYWRLFHKSWFVPFPHGSITYRREIFDRIGGYREQCVYWEDQDFLLRASKITEIVTIADPLYRHRHSQVSTRLASDQVRVEQAIDLMYRSIGRLQRGEDYYQLLEKQGQPSRVDPRVFVSLGSLALWAGERPRYLRRLFFRGKLSLNAATLSSLTWTAWASTSPGSLRMFLRALAALKNAAIGHERRDGAVVEWQTHSAPGR